MLKTKVAAGLLVGLVSATSTHAASVAYFLDQSNRLTDGVNYLMVTISDEREAGVIDFTVEALQPLLDLAGENFGIQIFGFNVVGGIGAEARNVTLLPDDWRARNGGRMDGFGLFDITMQARNNDKGKGHDDDDKKNGKGHDEHGNGHGYGHGDGDDSLNVQQPLTFSIAGVNLDTLLSYVDLSTGRAPEGFSFFSARVTGLNFGDCSYNGTYDNDTKGPSSFSPSRSRKKGSSGGSCTTSAYFGGTSAVPAPPAVWLLGTAVAGLVVRRLRGNRVAKSA